MKRPNRPSRGGFTLVEMLVVLAIIGILAALLIPAIWQAVLAARENVIIQEISQMQMAVESYRQSHNDYPPNFSEITAPADLQNVAKLPVRHLRRAFPKHSENLQRVFNDAPDGTGNLLVPDPSEVLVSWLSGLSKDPRLPITSNADRDIIFPFDPARLRDHDNNGLMSYFPRYLSASPYVYFDARNYGITGYANNNGENVFPYRSVRPLASGSHALDPQTEWINPTSFQIIAAGLDDEFGLSTVDVTSVPWTGVYKVFPDGMNYSDADWDNMSNFSEGKVFEDNIE